MKILCVCDEGNNRSVHIAHLLKYKGHDTIPVGRKTASPETLQMLSEWADIIILTDSSQSGPFLGSTKIRYWPIADQYPRAFNPSLNKIVRKMIADSDL